MSDRKLLEKAKELWRKLENKARKKFPAESRNICVETVVKFFQNPFSESHELSKRWLLQFRLFGGVLDEKIFEPGIYANSHFNPEIERLQIQILEEMHEEGLQNFIQAAEENLAGVEIPTWKKMQDFGDLNNILNEAMQTLVRVLERLRNDHGVRSTVAVVTEQHKSSWESLVHSWVIVNGKPEENLPFVSRAVDDLAWKAKAFARKKSESPVSESPDNQDHQSRKGN